MPFTIPDLQDEVSAGIDDTFDIAGVIATRNATLCEEVPGATINQLDGKVLALSNDPQAPSPDAVLPIVCLMPRRGRSRGNLIDEHLPLVEESVL